MTDMTISFLYFDGCPLAPRALENLMDAVEEIKSSVLLRFEEVNLMAPETPHGLKRWGSPTILVDGEDITGAQKGWGCSCRLYTSDGGVPTTPEIIEAISNRQNES